MGMCWTIAKLEVATSWKSLLVILQPLWQDLSRLWWTLLALHKGTSRLSWWEFSKLSPRKRKPQTIPLFLSINDFFYIFIFNKASCCSISYPIFLYCLCCLLQDVVVLILQAQICCFKPAEESPETPSRRSPKVKPELSAGNKSSIIL